TGRRVTFEYTLIKDGNDTAQDAEDLAKLLKGINCHVNLIPLNTVTETGLKSSSRTQAYAFAEKLSQRGIQCTVRRQLGADIDAACGQLRKKRS
ncbi:MAG: 23S rRNA (adenine(2503)-C(2))-methyltransferase RlmN, partial [Firmicutes bacterium]|nr:23S rRNA (adenine(2503)-C(2))-methyltransferase RlmN [Bacillota bacterium]